MPCFKVCAYGFDTVLIVAPNIQAAILKWSLMDGDGSVRSLATVIGVFKESDVVT